jgi:outer membrane protein TolC
VQGAPALPWTARIATAYPAMAYAAGVGAFTDTVSAQTGLAAARSAVARAHTQALINAAALAFATGELTSSIDVDRTTPP